MADNRIPRESATREKTERKRSWRRPELLPTPEPQEGWAYRYIRMEMLGKADPTNISSKLREGWEPVKASDHPELMMDSVDDPRFQDAVINGGLILCKAPTEMVEERTDFFRDQTRAQIQSVDNSYMREQDSRMPLFSDRKTKVSFGNGT
jgi:hypothetical protein